MSDQEPPSVTLSVYAAHHPLDRGNAAGRDHLVVSADFTRRRLRREAGDALCKASRKFWGLYPEPERKATCKRCLELAARHGLALPGTQGEKA